MSHFPRLLAVALATTVALPAGWYAASPHYTVAAMKQAALSADPEALEAHVDFQALRHSLKAELTTRLAAEARENMSPLAAFGASLALGFVDPFVETAVSPAMLRLALAGAADRVTMPELQALALIAAPGIEIDRHGFHSFTARLKGSAASAPQAVFRRHGLAWKLSALELPVEPQAPVSEQAAANTPRNRPL